MRRRRRSSASCAPSLHRRISPPNGRVVLDARDIHRALTRISHEILERNKGAGDLVLLGIPSRGVPLAQRIAERISAVEGLDVPVGSLDITMYRDDLRMKPARTLLPTEIPPGGIDDKTVVLVDDVLFSGRTIRAALDALNDVGRPRGGAARGARRPRPPRAADPGRLRRQEPPHLAGRAGAASRLEETDDVDAVSIDGTRRETSSMKRHLLSAADLSRDDAEQVLTTAEEMRSLADRPIKKLPALRGRTVVNLFFEDSTRTRISFEAAAKRLSADVINFAAKGSSLSKGESLKDTALTLEAMGADAVVVRHGASGAPHRLAHSGWVRSSVVNAGDGTHEHPTQALLDAFTMWRHLGLASTAAGSRSSATCCTAGWPAPTRCCCRPSAPRSPWSRRRRCCRSASTPGASRRRTTSTAVLPKADA